jgi:hypothetical protein
MSAQKQPLTKSLSAFAYRKALDEVTKRGTALPGHVLSVDGPFVTVNFDLEDATLPQLTLPLAWPEYDRLPIQPGNKGFAFPIGAYLGGITGQGGVANLAPLQGNLASLVWFPISNKGWDVPPGADADTRVVYGKTAVLLLDSIAGNSSIKLTSSAITLTCGGHTIVIDSAGVYIDGRVFLAHEHSNVQTGGSNSGGVV